MTNADTVRSFLEALQAGDLDAALSLLTEDAQWINVSLPAVRGRDKIERLNRYGFEKGFGFRVHFHNIATEGDTVLTERTDAISLGRVEQRFWVYGRFELRDGKIAIWRDSFDWGDIFISLLRAWAGAVVPSLNRRWPGDS
jgi:limonene-1,2-epoxide hydrolase